MVPVPKPGIEDYKAARVTQKNEAGAVGLPLGRWQRDQEADIHGQTLIVSAIEGVALAGLDKPAVLRRGPEHEIEHGHRAEGSGRRHPLRSDADHEFQVLRQLKRLLENDVGFPFGAVAASQPGNPGLDLQPMLDRRDLQRDAGTEADLVFAEAIFSRQADFQNRPPMIIIRGSPPKAQPGPSARPTTNVAVWSDFTTCPRRETQYPAPI